VRGLIEAVAARLDARLERDVERPVVVGLSGGGDSLALLLLVCAWARTAGRRVVAVTVDHGLHADSRGWSGVCRAAATRHGADWVERHWTGDKPTTGLPAAARQARHGLLAEAARSVGARVILLGHTADDRAEADWMRARGATLGDVREWGPSPVWPEGRGMALFRPLLEVRRAELREYLGRRGETWIEDPANEDGRFQRSRARAALDPLPAGEGLRLAERSDALSRKGEGQTVGAGAIVAHPNQLPLTLSRKADRSARGRSSPLRLGEGSEIGRSASVSALAATLLCASGTMRPPRGDRLARLADRLRSGERFAATLCGARVTAEKYRVVICREAGRGGLARLSLEAGTPAVWDGRYEIAAPAPGWIVTAAAGLQACLPAEDRRILSTVAPFARPTLPVLIRDDGSGARLAWREATVRALGPRRLSLTLGETTHERDLERPVHGETPPTDLFSEATGFTTAG
jgi:tRNA(Ile)-lysidine synthase